MSAYFDHAPISSYVFLMTLVSMLMGSSTSHSHIALDLSNIYNGEVYRIALSPLFFLDTPQVIVGLILIYTLRQLERQMGSRKFGAFVLLSYVISLLAQVALIVTFSSVGYDIIPSPGPFYYIFSILPFFHYYIPKLKPSNYSLLGFSIVLSEKIWFYLLAIQLLFSDGISSIIPGVSGLIASYTYSIDGLNLSSFRLPAFVEVSY